MANITAQTLAQLVEDDDSITPEDFVATLMQIREARATHYRIELPWSPQNTDTSMVLLWNKNELKFEMQEDSYNKDGNYQETFTERYLEEFVKPNITFADWNYIQWLKVEV